MGLQRVGHDWVAEQQRLYTHTHTIRENIMQLGEGLLGAVCEASYENYTTSYDLWFCFLFLSLRRAQGLYVTGEVWSLIIAQGRHAEGAGCFWVRNSDAEEKSWEEKGKVGYPDLFNTPDHELPHELGLVFGCWLILGSTLFGWVNLSRTVNRPIVQTPI